MDLSTSDASSPFNCNNQSDKCLNNRRLIGPFSNYSKPQYCQSEPSKVSDRKKARSRRRILIADKREMKLQSDRKCREKKKLMVENLTAENRDLKMEYDRLTEEIRQLKEDIKWLRPNRQLTDQELKKLESYLSQSTSLRGDNKSVSAQSHAKQDLEKIISINEGVGIKEYIAENKENSLSATCNDSASVTKLLTESVTCNDSISVTKLLTEIDADDQSNVKWSDFSGLSEERCLPLGKFRLPYSLFAISERIKDAHGDISATSKISPSVSNTIYILLCATIKEMDELQLEEVSESHILKWKDAIKDALRIGFQVEFAMKHLKKIVRAYIGLEFHKRLDCLDVNISKLETELKNRKEEHALLSEQAKLYADCLEEFRRTTVSYGLLP